MSLSNDGNVDMQIHLIKLSGPLNEGQYEKITRMFRDVSAQGVERVVVDLDDVPLIDSRGLAALVAGYKLFGRDPKNFRLVALQDQPRLVFELTGFDNIFEIFDNLAEATALESALCLELPHGLSLPISVSPTVELDLTVN
jgi:anti-anti-sigma factor